MYISTTLAAASSLLALSSALPQAAPNATATIPETNLNIAQLRASNRVSQVPAGTKVPGPIALSSAYNKYRKAAPTAVVQAAQLAAVAYSATISAPKQSGSVAANPEANDQAYLVPVTVGRTVMNLDLDTGSSDFWVFSSLLSASERGNHSIYKLGGKKEAGETWSIAYGDGSGASGNVYRDQVTIGSVVNPAQDIEVASDVSNSFTTGQPDGLIGLGFPIGNTCSPSRCTPFFQNISASLPSPVFAAALKHNAPGAYDFGFIDPSQYTGALTYANVNDDLGAGYWEFNSGGYAIGNGTKKARSMIAIADTGTSLALVDDVVVTAFYAASPTAYYNSTYGAMVFPCADTANLADLSFYMGGAKHTMPGAYGVYAELGDGTCYGGIQSNSGIGFTILGDVFLKSQYVVFSTKGPKIGFAQQAGVTI